MVLLSLAFLFALLIWLQGFIYNRFWNRGLEVELKFSTPAGVEGGSIQMTERITSRKPLPLPWLIVKFQVSRDLIFTDKMHASITDDYYREDLFSIGMYQRISRNLTVNMKKRGYYTIKSIDMVSADLLLIRKLVDHADSHSRLTVCPRLISREDLEIPYRQLMGAVLARDSLQPDPFEFRTIREYQGFDNLRSINWLATARTGQLKVNVHENTASREVVVFLNVEPDSSWYEEALVEEAIRIAASICAYLNEDGISCGLVTNARDSVNGCTVEMAAGQSLQHNQQIQEQLGRLDLRQKPGRFMEILEVLPQPRINDPVLLFISLDCSQALCTQWNDCLELGYKGLWIVPFDPAHKGRRPEIEAPVFMWEVGRHD
jgi:uncharacterized protein (DUF58 family)